MHQLSFAFLIALIGFPQISETIYTPALPSIATGLQASTFLVELTLAIYFIGFAIGVALWGCISDKYGRRLTMLVGLILYGIATLACGSASTIEELLGWRLLQAFGASVGSVITQTIIRDIYQGEERAKIFSCISGALAFSPAIGPLMGGFISEWAGWRANFWFLATLAIGLILWCWFTLPETRPVHLVRPSFKQLSQRMFTSFRLWGHILLISSTNGIIFGFYQEAPFIFIEQLHMKPSHYGLVGLLIAAATVIAAHFSYRVSQVLSSEFLIQCGALSVTVGGIIFTLITATGLLPSIGMVCSLWALFVVFFGIGLIIPHSLSLALKPYQSTVGAAGSLFGGSYYILIAGYTAFLSFFHNGTLWPLPIYILVLGMLLLMGSALIQSNAHLAQENQ